VALVDAGRWKGRGVAYRTDLATLAQQRCAKIFALCPESIDFLVAARPENVTYLSGYKSMGHDCDRAHRMAAVAGRDSCWVVAPAADFGPAMEILTEPSKFFPYGKFYFTSAMHPELGETRPASASYLEAIKSCLKESVPAGSCVGLDRAELGDVSEMLTKAFPSHHFIDATQLLAQARSTKLMREIELISVATALTERGISTAFGQAKGGATEIEIASIITSVIASGGGVPGFVVVTSGERSALSDTYPSSRRLQVGDLVRVDVGCSVEGYWSDTARTAIVGEPSALVRHRYEAISKGVSAERKIVRAGVKVSDVFHIGVETVKASGIDNYRRHHCGHGIGLESYEFPKIGPENESVLLEGMVLCLETPFYELGWGGMMTEDTVVVTRDGNTLLTHLDRELFSI
jgi:Xaa-Pro dipeptidase